MPQIYMHSVAEPQISPVKLVAKVQIPSLQTFSDRLLPLNITEITKTSLSFVNGNHRIGLGQ